MRICSRAELNENKWLEWCENDTTFSPFSSLSYLDAVAENCCFLINDENTGGLALPYISRFRIKTLCTPIFCRWTKWVGQNQPSPEDLSLFLKKEFLQADVYMESTLLGAPDETLIYQTIALNKRDYNSQVKRKLKKAASKSFEIDFDIASSEAVAFIKQELTHKFDTLAASSFDRLSVLVEKLASDQATNSNELKTIGLRENKTRVGVLILICSEENCLYLKGACTENVKLAGGMYVLMDTALQFAAATNRHFDFGGSRISGVRQFNQSFGGKDQTYYHYRWSNGPIWYSLLKKIRNKWKNR